LLKIQEYLTLLSSNTVEFDLKQVDGFEQEIIILMENVNRVLDCYKFLLTIDEFRLDDTNEKCMELVNRILIDIKMMQTWINKIRDRYDLEYQEVKKIHKLTKKLTQKIFMTLSKEDFENKQ
jgi:hypothetical protein